MNVASQQTVPLSTHQGGVVRVAGTRVSLDSVVHAYNEGASAEEIVERFPSLLLADVYTVIGYYLTHKSDVDAYVRRRQDEAATIQAEIESKNTPVGRRDRLLARLATRRSSK